MLSKFKACSGIHFPPVSSRRKRGAETVLMLLNAFPHPDKIVNVGGQYPPPRDIALSTHIGVISARIYDTAKNKMEVDNASSYTPFSSIYTFKI